MYRTYVPALRPSGFHRISEPPRLRKTASTMSLPPLPLSRRLSTPPAPISRDEIMADTRPMPKRTREDFLAMHRLGAALDALARDATPRQVAACCASALVDALQAHAVVIHHHDAARRELHCIGVHGPNAAHLLGTTTSVEDDVVATATLTNKKPIFHDGACIAVLELVGVEEDRQQRVADACELVAHHLAMALAATPAEPAEPSIAPEIPPPPTVPAAITIHLPIAGGSSRASDPFDAERHPRSPITFPKRAPTLLCRHER